MSSMSAGSTPDLATACFTAWAAMETVGVMLKPPRTDLARPVRAYETTTASRILEFLPNIVAERRRLRAALGRNLCIWDLSWLGTDALRARPCGNGKDFEWRLKSP